MTSTYLNYLTFERSYGRPLESASPDDVDPRSDIAREAEYFRENIGKVSTAAELLRDDRLYEFALTAFGLSDQIPNKEFIGNVLDQGVFDPFTDFTSEERLLGQDQNGINQIAEAFWFSEEFILPSLREDAIVDAVDDLTNRYVAANGGVLTDALVTEINYFNDRIVSITSGEDLVKDERLLRLVLSAYNQEDQIGNGELIGKAIDAGVYNPGAAVRKTGSLANTLNDSRYDAFARGFAFNEIGDQNTKSSEFVENVIDRYSVERLEAQAKEARDSELPRNAISGVIQRDSEYFLENIGKVTSIEEFLDNDRLYRYALTAFDLESQIDSKGLVRKVLEEGVEDDDALANQLIDKKFRDFAAAFGFAEVGTRNTRNPNFAADVVERYERVAVETDAGEDNIGVRLGAYFDRQAGGLTSWFSFLGDQALREVLFTAFVLPDEMQQTNPDKLVQIFESRFDIEDFADPVERQKFIERFTLMYDIRNGAPGGSQALVLELYGVTPEAPTDAGGASISSETLSATLF